MSYWCKLLCFFLPDVTGTKETTAVGGVVQEAFLRYYDDLAFREFLMPKIRIEEFF